MSCLQCKSTIECHRRASHCNREDSSVKVKNSARAHVVKWGVEPTDSIVKVIKNAAAAPASESSTRRQPPEVSRSPFATRGAQIEDFVLDDAVRDLGRHHLLGMGYGLIGTGYLGPRHA